jgi:hypothetical protein
MVASAQQGRGGAPPPLGIVYNTAMARPDAALALSLLYALADERRARASAVCVTGAGLQTAVFCDIIGRFFVPTERNGNQALAVGLALAEPLPPDSPMVKPAVARTAPDGAPQYARGITGIADTSQAEAVLRNGVIFSARSAVVLSAPATVLARTLDLFNTRAEYARRVARLVIVDTPAVRQDVAALRRVLSEWPTPIVICPREVGTALQVSTDMLDQAFAGFPAHPVVDAYRAFRPPPYEVTLDDAVAVHYAVQPDSGLFVASDAGTVIVNTDGTFSLTPGAGDSRLLRLAPGRQAAARVAIVALASARPTPPAGGRGR